MIMGTIYTFFAAMGFGLVSNAKGKSLLFASIGGGLGWFVYLLCKVQISEVASMFIATVVVSLYSEFFSRILKIPAITMVMCGIFPLVPGNGMYYTMLAIIQGKNSEAMTLGIDTLMKACTMALALALVTSFTRMFNNKKLLDN